MNPRGRDPFDNAIVSDAWSSLRGNVPAVHEDIFEQCTTRVHESWAEKQPKSLLIHGSAGSGKTHLLARLRAAVTAADEGPIFCYVRLSTAPNMIRRHLRRCLVNDLVRYDAGGMSQLDHVLVSCLDKQLHGETPTPRGSLAARLETLRSEASQWEVAREAFQDIAQRLQIVFNLARTCGYWLKGRRRADVVEWLATGDLPDESRSAMGLTARAEDDADESPEQIAGEFVNSLVRVITETRSLVLCFDQIEALQTSPGDRDGFYAFGRMVSDVFDLGLPTVFITCAQSMLLPAIKTHIPAPFLDRLAQDERVLAQLSDQQARDLIRSRINAWDESASAVRSKDDPLWPLNEEMLGRFMRGPPQHRRCAGRRRR
ncbi:MAG: ATP-binding protein, partial [Betaproteobacteria bacterium]|nr:ATP-binding protein [Betaproteobacteria bacterium]